LDRDNRVRARARSMSLLQSSISLVLLLLLQETKCCRAWTTASCWRTSTAVERAFGRGKVAFLSLDDSLPDDQDLPDPQELQQSMNDLFRIKKKPSVNQDLAGGYSLTDLEDYFSQRTPGSRSPARPIPKFNASLEEAFPEGGDGLYLDPDLYAKSSEWLNPDGSLNLPDDEERLKSGRTGPDYQRILRAIMQPAPNSPDSLAPSGDIQNMEDVWQALQQQASMATTTNSLNVTATSEELHRQVFAEEQGYLQQSQVFRESLTDSSKAAEAASLRHGQQFRQRQDDAMASLDEQIKEWEEGWEENYSQAQHCSKCLCILAQDEIPMARKHQGLCQVCYGDVLVAKSNNFDSSAGPLQSRPASRTTLTRPRITSARTDLDRVRPDDTTQAIPTETSPTNPSPPPAPLYASSTSSEAPSQLQSPPPPVPRQPEVRRLKTGGTFRPRPTDPTSDGGTVQRREPNKEKDLVESFRRDRAQETLAPRQRTGPTPARVERTVGDSRSPPVSQDPTKPPRNWPQRPTRPTQPDPMDSERQNDSNENSLVSPPTNQSNVGQPSLLFFATTELPPPSKDANDANAFDDK
jgi:hypothetical protein